MRRCLLLLFLFCTSQFQSLSAQTPHLDSIHVVEDSGYLILQGVFGPQTGSVRVDSTALPILFWSDRYVVASIPDTGKGCAGTTQVQSAKGLMSNSRTLELFSLRGLKTHREQHSIPSDHSESFEYFVRFDLESSLAIHSSVPILFKLNRASRLRFNAQQSSSDAKGRILDQVDDIYAERDSSGHDLFKAECRFDPTTRQFVCAARSIQAIRGTAQYYDSWNTNPPDFFYTPPDIVLLISLDSSYAPRVSIHDTVFNFGTYFDRDTTGGDIYPTFSLGLTAVELPRHQKSIERSVAFLNGSISLTTGSRVKVWDLQGRIVFESAGRLDELQLSLLSLRPGYYFFSFLDLPTLGVYKIAIF